MDCYGTLKELGQYLCCRAPARAEIEIHLGCCRSCHAVYETDKGAMQLQCSERVELPEPVRERLREVVQAVVSEDKATIIVERDCQPRFGVAYRPEQRGQVSR